MNQDPSIFREGLASNAQVLARMAADANYDLETVIGFCRETLRFLTEAPEEDAVPDSKDISDLVLDSYEGTPFLDVNKGLHLVKFGLTTIDGSLVSNKGSLGVIAGKTSTGKTTLAVQAMINTLCAGRKCLIFSMEMTREEVAAKWIANRRNVNSYAVLKGHADNRPAVEHRTEEFIDTLNLAANTYVISDGTCTRYDALCKSIRREVATKGIEVVFIDYFTLVNPPDTRNKNANTAYILGQMSKGFKELAKDLGICIVLISQFNREVDDGDEPHLKHLRETGQLEQDANWAILMWTEQKVNPPNEPYNVYLKIAKDRFGGRNVKCLTKFDPAVGRFEELGRLTVPFQDELGI